MREERPIPRLIEKNDKILNGEVRLIDVNNDQLGIMPAEEALAKAQERGADLVLVAEQLVPPVCRIMNFGKHVYEKKKLVRDQRKKQVKTGSKTKELKFHANIDTHDYEIKLNHIKGFLKKGYKVKVSLFFRGREMRNTEHGMKFMINLGKEIQDVGNIESNPRLIGRNIGMLLIPISQKNV